MGKCLTVFYRDANIMATCCLGSLGSKGLLPDQVLL